MGDLKPKFIRDDFEPIWLENLKKHNEDIFSCFRDVPKMVIDDLDRKKNNFIEDLIKKKLNSFGYSFIDDNIFYQFIKERVFKLNFDGNQDVYEFILDFNVENKTGKFICGITEKTTFGSEINKVSASIVFDEYNESKVLKAV